ncbi:MAG: 4Fe-4S binding protein [Elusimicrobia bacterium]|nr:4Fe-4S binding protein [Elusimicrobiota bacterium]
MPRLLKDGARLRRKASPLFDFFGSRVSSAAVEEGLCDLGLGSFSLSVTDQGLGLRIPRAVSWEKEARAVTWLKGMFSPMVQCRVEYSSSIPMREVLDLRQRQVLTVSLVEVFGPAGLRQALPLLVSRLGLAPSAGLSPRPGSFLSMREWREGMRWSQVQSGDAKPCFLSWQRPGGAKGVRSAWLVAASSHPEALDWLAHQLEGEPIPSEHCDILLDGLEWGVARRPCIAAQALSGFDLPVTADQERCKKCGLCVRVCPVQCLDKGGAFKDKAAVGRCLRCFDCVEACPQDARRPVYGASSATLSRALLHRPGWLSRLAGKPGPASPLPFPPSYLLPKPGPERRPRWVLGLAVTTLQEHAAALFKDGKLESAVEEERYSRSRHHGWHAPGRPGVGFAMDPTICVEETFPRGALAGLLGPRKLSLDELDLIAVNGIPARYRRAFSPLDAKAELPLLKAGRVVYIPHHLCHAASAFRMSGLSKAWILTVDGRGDRETAAVFHGQGEKIQPVSELLSLTDRSIGGVYETVTRLLGFGAHGQGSVMALASFGKPGHDLKRFLSWPSIHSDGIDESFHKLARREGEPLTKAHQDLAASLQDALESTIIGLLESAGLKPGAEGLCFAGGVALNCRLNQRLREVFKPKKMFVQPGANDAGTALGAGLEALSLSGVRQRAVLRHSLLGPSYSKQDILKALKKARVPFKPVKDAPKEAGRRLADGQVVCWFDGSLEFGPRALGSRSILADPRNPKLKDRVNRIKDREPWRPFGPSILSGHESRWFDHAFDSRFMLFTLPVKRSQASRVSAIVHVDGTSRPQVVRREFQPRYHALIRRFHGLTKVPMVLNTSFNRRGEPIVCSPEDALTCFAAMASRPGGPDCLFLGDFLVENVSSIAH